MRKNSYVSQRKTSKKERGRNKSISIKFSKKGHLLTHKANKTNRDKSYSSRKTTSGGTLSTQQPKNRQYSKT